MNQGEVRAKFWTAFYLIFQFVKSCMKKRTFFRITSTPISFVIVICIGTKQSSIARLESGLFSGNLPSLTMLKKYADAVGKKLQIRLV